MDNQIDKALADPFVGPLLDIFLQSFNEKMALLQAAFASHDAVKSKQLLHNLKGSAAMYGFATIADYFAEMEQTGAADTPETQAYLKDIEAFSEELRSKLA